MLKIDGFYCDLQSFGEELKNIRKSLNLTQKDVAEQIYISTDTLRKIENGKVMPKQETLDLLSVNLRLFVNSWGGYFF